MSVELSKKSSSLTDRHRSSRVAVRAMPGAYLVCLFVASFLSALLAYLGYITFAGALALVSWIVVPLGWLTDRIVFDGKRIKRTGLVPRLLARATGIRDRLKISDIEQIETTAFPGVKRGRNIYYTYHTAVTGKTARFVFSSGHRGYLDVIRSLLSSVPEDVLDNTSIDLRDYLVEKGEIRRRAAESEIPSSDVLDASFRDIKLQRRHENLTSAAAEE
ncbi:MAG TPA: hypothetical protein VFZ23_00940, partial [Pyrinomonadaceae bacterium]